MNVSIIYDSKFGNNKQIAEALENIFKEDNSVHVHHAKDVLPKEVIEEQPDILLFGGPLRAGMISFTIKRWVHNFSKLLKKKGIKVNKVAAWGTHGINAPDTPEKLAWKNLEPKWKALMDYVPAEKTMSGIQGIGVLGMEGPLEAEWQSIVAQFAERIKNL